MKITKRAIIFIPGFKGSQLYNQTGQLIWPNVIRAQFSNTTLQYNLPDLDLYNKSHYYPSGIVKTVNVIPHLWKKDIYGEFLTSLESQIGEDTQLLTFAYDWRKNLTQVVSLLNAEINKLITAGIKQIEIISHSMGGLIAAYLFRYGKCNLNATKKDWVLSKYISKILFVAVPFRGAIRTIRDLLYGTKLGFNHSLLSSQALCTFPSIYYLLPSYENAISKNSNDAITELSAYDITLWDNYQISILNQTHSTIKIQQLRKAYLNHHLILSKQFHDALHASTDIKDPINKVEIITMNGRTQNTPSTLEINENLNQLIWKDQEGDGSVPFHSSFPPEAFKIFSQKNYSVNADHSAIFQSESIQKIILNEFL